jgi:hypothetical protein
MLALVLLGESYVASQPIRFTSVPSLARRFSLEAAGRLAAGHDVLLLGDSMVKLGLIPVAFDEKLGRSAYNLAIPSAPAPVTYYTLRRALKSGARPTAIVVDFGPSLLAADPAIDPLRRAGLPELGEFVDLLFTVRDKEFATQFLVNGLLPSVRSRLEIRGCVLAALKGDRCPQTDLNTACWRNWRLNQGAHVAAKNPAYVDAPQAGADRKFAGKVHIKRANVEYVDRLFTLAEANGIRVYWLIPPVSPLLLEQRVGRGVESYFTDFAHKIQSKHPAVTVLDARFSGFGTTFFIDSTHLDVEGALALSAEVADQLKAAAASKSGPARWIDLPQPSPTSISRHLEDLDQSRSIVALASERTRR